MTSCILFSISLHHKYKLQAFANLVGSAAIALTEAGNATLSATIIPDRRLGGRFSLTIALLFEFHRQHRSPLKRLN